MRPLPTAAVLVALLALAIPPADAKSTGPCTILVEGEDLSAGEATIAAPSDGNLSYLIVAPVPVLRWSVTLHFGPIEKVVLERDFEAGATTEEGTFSIADYTKYGSGLYQVTGHAELSDGTDCAATMGLKIGGNPLTTVLGLAAVAVLGAAGVGILLMILQIVLDAKDVVEAAKDFLEQAKHTVPAIAGTAAPPPDDPGPPRPPSNP